MVIKDNLHNKLDGNRLDFTKSLNKRESNIYDLTLFKENAKKVILEKKCHWNLLLPVETIHPEKTHFCIS